VLTSPAIRTTQTTSILREVWGAEETAITVLEDGYLASDRAWLGWINALSDEHEQAWIVGHNPGLSELVERLTEQPLWLPTCGMAEIELQIEQWDAAFAGVGRLRGLFTPKSSLCP
jgi:phosphohistidine phosphatase|tara:strand:- start:815 stop:1162 length:348 start_codon:yes stop_codon:yes gene_type:complete